MTNAIQPPDWKKILRPGQRIYLGSGAACPLKLMEDMLPHIKEYGDLEIVHGMTLGPSPWTEEGYNPYLKVNAFYLDPRLSALVNAGMDEYTPVHYSEIPQLFRDGVLRIDVALIMVSPPDDYGYCSLGTTVGWAPDAIDSARYTVAQINPAMPKTSGLSYLHYSEIDYALEVEAPLPELSSSEQTQEMEQIGEYVSQLINDGDTLQFGVGPVGTCVGRSLAQHRQLGIHSEVIGNEVMELFRSGVIDNSRKSLLPGKVVTAQALGNQELYSFVDENPHIEFRPIGFVNNPLNIARNERMVSVNSALMVDLSGQVVVDSLRGMFRSGVGSTIDFVRGAAMSEGGRPIIALPSTGEEGGKRISRIVTELEPGAGVGCHRADVHYVVTEYGIATLRGRTIQERAQELIQVAHPDFRDSLLEEARKNHLVPGYFQLPPPPDRESFGIPSRRVKLKDNKHYLLRPLTPADDRRLQEFFYSHTEDTIVRRYGFTVTRMSRERAFELVGIDQNKDLALAVVELQGPRQVIHAVGRYYLDSDGKGAEMAFVVGENKRRLGMAYVLFERMMEIAKKRKLQYLWAQVDSDNTAMLKLFRKYNAEEQSAEDYHTVNIVVRLKDISVDKQRSVSEYLHFTRNKKSKDHGK